MRGGADAPCRTQSWVRHQSAKRSASEQMLRVESVSTAYRLDEAGATTCASSSTSIALWRPFSSSSV